MTTSPVEERAYHEAGHAVMLRFHNIPFGGILMQSHDPDKFQARTYGFELGEWIRSANGDQEERIRAALDILASGEAAQFYKTKNELNSVQGAQRDWSEARKILRGCTDDDGKALNGQLMADWWEAARSNMKALCQSESIQWKAIEALAEELINQGDMNFGAIVKIVDPILGLIKGKSATY